MPTVQFESLSPVLPVNQIEPCLGFWTERLGFAEVASVPEGDHKVFSMLSSGAVTVMYQTRASIERDEPALARSPLGTAALFIRVDDLQPLLAALEGVEVIAGPVDRFYGMRELTVREPGGHVVTFAQPLGDGA